jgi:hypothetical protein
MKEIKLTRGKVAMVDDEDFELVSKYKWHSEITTHNCYAKNSIREKGEIKTTRMHGLIIGTHTGVIDHINRNGLDNRRINLRVVSVSDNIRNTPGKSITGMGFKGVYKQKGNKRFMAAICQNGGKLLHLGLYVNPEDAARAYDTKAYSLYGGVAYLNFPRKTK